MGFPLPSSGGVTEDTNVVGGQLVATGDADLFFWPFSEAGRWVAETQTGAYGSQLVIQDDGVWTYTADNSNPMIQALNTGDTLTETFTITTWRGATTTVTINIDGLDEPPCFVRGTLIKTPGGVRPVEDLKRGDIVLTRDNGPQRIKWVGSRRVGSQDVADFDQLRPIRILKGTFAPGVPDRDLLLSPMHNVLVRGAMTSLLLGESEVFCPARLLVNGCNILRDAVTEVEYFHVLFDSHQVVSSNGCPTESFLPGPVGMSNFDAQAREEILTLFPELRSMPGSYGPVARRVAKAFEARLLAQELRPVTGLGERLRLAVA